MQNLTTPSNYMTDEEYAEHLLSFSIRLGDKLASDTWLSAHEAQIKALFPEDWTHIQIANYQKVGQKLIELGVKLESKYDLFFALSIFEVNHFFIRAGVLIKRNPEQIYRSTVH